MSESRAAVAARAPGGKLEHAVLRQGAMTSSAPSLSDRALGAYLGLAIGDALGATVEFMTAGEIAATYRLHRQIVGGGWLRLKPGRVTDDTEMSLALGGALLARGGWDLRTIAEAFAAWLRSRPRDVGSTCRRGIRRYMLHGTLCAEPAEDDAGNGAVMRNLPVVLASVGDPSACTRRSLEQAHLTHRHPLSDAAVVALARMTLALLEGRGREAGRAEADRLVGRHPEFRFTPWPGRTGGYVVDTVQSVFDTFLNTADFEECLVTVVNRGGDADTAGALAGQLAGALYGIDAIPARWLRRLDPAVNRAIRRQVEGLLALARKGVQAGRLALSVNPTATLPTVFSRCNLSPWIIASREFQEEPQPLELDGVRATERRLFERLAEIESPAERGQVFHDYLSVKFRLHEWPEHRKSARSSLRHSYVQFLLSWGADSNGRAGAVLKAWAESRFGLPASYHQGRLATDPAARERYRHDRMRGATLTVGVTMQLDLLYTFCQEELRRRHPGRRWLTLYRGTHDPEEYEYPEGTGGRGGPVVVRLNNLSSFTADREVAWEFGSSVWEVQVPREKVVFFSGLLPPHLLGGESEFLVLGGDYRVQLLGY